MAPKFPMKKCACCKKKYKSFLGIQTKGGDWLCRKCWYEVRAILTGVRESAKTLLKALPTQDK